MDKDIQQQMAAVYEKAIDTTGEPRCERCIRLGREVPGIARVRCACGLLCHFCFKVDSKNHASEHGY